MSNLFNKVKEAATGYKDNDTGKSGFGGIAADGQKAYKNYQTDAADGSVDWKKQATGVFGDVKSGIAGEKSATGGGGAAPTS